jgi:cytochrome P450
MPATFWLFWHMVRDRSLLARAIPEVSACRASSTNNALSFDTTKLCNQPLLQSSYAETLRLYVAVYIIRKPEYEDAQVLDYKIPKDKMIVVSSAMAHTDKQNWNLGTLEEHPVERFWADRFLTYGANTSRCPSASVTATIPPTSSSAASSPSLHADSKSNPPEAKFSLNGYSGAWIPFGGGIHQCPGRHWVKLQMLLSFAIISSAFDIELVPGKAKLKVDMAKYGLGALNPAEKAGFRIRRKPTVA